MHACKLAMRRLQAPMRRCAPHARSLPGKPGVWGGVGLQWILPTSWLLHGRPRCASICVEAPSLAEKWVGCQVTAERHGTAFLRATSVGALGDPIVKVQDVANLKISDVHNNKELLQACFILAPSKTPKASELAEAVDKLMTAHGLHTHEESALARCM